MRIPLFLKVSTVIVSAVLVSCLAYAQPTADRYPRSTQDDRRPAIDCVAEAAAFMEVAGLADRFQNDGEVFAGSLYELREQLFDCLATSDDDTIPDLSSGFDDPVDSI